MLILSGAILLLAPLIRGGNRQISLVILLALGLLLLAVLAANLSYSRLQQNQGIQNRWEPKMAWRHLFYALLISSPLWLGILYLSPLPLDWWSSLAGRNIYKISLQDLQIVTPPRLAISLTLDATWASILAGIPVIAMFCVATVVSTKTIKQLLVILIFTAALQVLLSTLQLAFGINSIFYFDHQVGGSVIGSFANRNHLASFIVMTLPVCIYVFYNQSLQRKSNILIFQSASSKRVILAFLLFLGFSLLSILLATLSRGGLMSGFIAIGMSIFIYMQALGNKVSNKQRLINIVLAVIFILLAVLFSELDGIQSRLGKRLLTDAEFRNAITKSTITAAMQFWPWGTGLGSFEAVYPRFQPSINLGSSGYIEYAHNDYAQILMELGLAGVVLMLIFAILFIHQVFHIISVYRLKRHLNKNIVMQSLCGVSLLAFLMHSWVEFNMHIPALAIVAAFLGGVFLRNPNTDAVTASKKFDKTVFSNLD